MVARPPALILCLFLVIPAYCAEVRVSHLHPRVYVRCDAAQVGRGVTVSEMRQRLRRQEYVRWRRPVSGGGPAAILEMAMRYLEEGDAGVLREVTEFLR